MMAAAQQRSHANVSVVSLISSLATVSEVHHVCIPIIQHALMIDSWDPSFVHVLYEAS